MIQTQRQNIMRIGFLILLGIALVPLNGWAQPIDLNSGSGYTSSGGGAGSGRGIGIQALSNYNVTSIGIFAGLNLEAHDVTIYSSTDGNQVGAILAQASATVGGLGDQWYDIPISYTLQAGQYYVLSWAPVDNATGWVSGNIEYLFDTNLPFTVGPIQMINGTEGFDATDFSNSLHPNLRLGGSAAPPVTGTPIPTVSEWGLISFILVLSSLGLVAIVRRKESEAIA